MKKVVEDFRMQERKDRCTKQINNDENVKDHGKIPYVFS